MGIVWTNPKELNNLTKKLQEIYDRKSITFLQSVGERVVKKARIAGSYMDRTANLRNSIGYIIVQYGYVVNSSFDGNISPNPKYANEANSEEAKQSSYKYATRIAATLSKKKTYLIVVAGMNYAKYVEARGYDVLQSSESWVEASANTLIREFERYFKETL